MVIHGTHKYEYVLEAPAYPPYIRYPYPLITVRKFYTYMISL